MISSRRTGVLLSLVVGLILLGFTPIQTGAIRLSEFYPFGPDFDEVLDVGNDPSATVDLTQPIPYFGQDRNQITVSLIIVSTDIALYSFMIYKLVNCTHNY